MEKPYRYLENTRLSCQIDYNGNFLAIDETCSSILLDNSSSSTSTFFNSCPETYAKLFTSFLPIVEDNEPARIILKHQTPTQLLEIEWTVTSTDNGTTFFLNGQLRPDYNSNEIQQYIQEYSYPILLTDRSNKVISFNKMFEQSLPGLGLPQTLIGMDLNDLLIDQNSNFTHEPIPDFLPIPLQLYVEGHRSDHIVVRKALADITVAILLPHPYDSLTKKALQQKEEDINTFIYKVSHDFKGPLTSLNGVLDIAADELKDSAFIPFLNMIRTCSDKLEALITTLLELSRVQATPIVEDVTDLSQLVSELTFEIRKQLPQLYDSVQLCIPETFPPFTTDVRVFRIALKHLLLNAFVFQKKTRQQPRVELKVTRGSTTIEFEIIDNGLGIPENKLERVFEMFYKASDYSVGTGMGLYLAQVAIQRLSGTLVLESKLDEGTKAIIKLPQR